MKDSITHNASEPLQPVLLRAASEAADLTAAVARLESEIATILDAMNGAGSNGVQHADTIRQGVEGLAVFLERLAYTFDGTVNCDPANAANAVPMRAQAQRLAGLAPGTPAPAPDNTEVWSD